MAIQNKKIVFSLNNIFIYNFFLLAETGYFFFHYYHYALKFAVHWKNLLDVQGLKMNTK